MTLTTSGYTQINNDLLEALIQAPLSKRQLCVVLAIVRQTCGFHREVAQLSGSRLADMTGLHRQHCVKALAELELMQVIFRSGGKRGQLIRLNFKYSDWCDTDSVTARASKPETQRHQNGDTFDTDLVTKRHQSSVDADTETVHIKEKKENSKETLKENGARTQRTMFEAWWEAYPKKRSKGQAWKAWQTIKPDEQLLADMLLSVKAAMKTPDWKKQAG